jgi:dynamin 1-like protein
VEHIKAILPELKARISTQMVTMQKELASYGELTESKVNPSDLLHKKGHIFDLLLPIVLSI